MMDVSGQENTENAVAFTVKSLNINLVKYQIHKQAVGTIDCTEQNRTEQHWQNSKSKY